ARRGTNDAKERREPSAPAPERQPARDTRDGSAPYAGPCGPGGDRRASRRRWPRAARSTRRGRERLGPEGEPVWWCPCSRHRFAKGVVGVFAVTALAAVQVVRHAAGLVGEDQAHGGQGLVDRRPEGVAVEGGGLGDG